MNQFEKNKEITISDILSYFSVRYKLIIIIATITTLISSVFAISELKKIGVQFFEYKTYIQLGNLRSVEINVFVESPDLVIERLGQIEIPALEKKYNAQGRKLDFTNTIYKIRDTGLLVLSSITVTREDLTSPIADFHSELLKKTLDNHTKKLLEIKTECKSQPIIYSNTSIESMVVKEEKRSGSFKKIPIIIAVGLITGIFISIFYIFIFDILKKI